MKDLCDFGKDYFCGKSQLLSCVFLLFSFIVFYPSQAFSAVVNHSGIISADTTWSALDVHLVTETVTVNTGVTLTIEPGTVVKFNSNKGLTINGALDASGNLSQEIIFTSYRDDTYGGDTNGDGISYGAPGDWSRIYSADSTNETFTKIKNTVIRYGGSYGYGNIYT